VKVIKGGVSTALGFKANGIVAGIKRSGKLDLALIASSVPAASAGVFTKNSIKAAPLLVSMKHIKRGKSQAFIVNSGNANCFTGDFGFKCADDTTKLIGKLLNIPKESVIVTSTGIIGRPLPFEKIEKNAQVLVKGLSAKGGLKAAEAILTTDLKVKEAAVEIALDGKTVIVGGCAKGSGMIAPNMATMLAFFTTDVAITSGMLKEALKIANENSFNQITVDGCMSTNDMAVIMANGLAGNKTISSKGKNFDMFCEALHYVCRDLAKRIVLDGEGATKFIEVHIDGAKNNAQAKEFGLAIANSVLVKTAAFGSNPNWGRVAAAVGSLGISKITEKTLKIRFSPFEKKEISIMVDLQLGQGKAVIYTCDLSYNYVKINGEYN
jgi:glutamate N-acetyltransferase/amino-acid N-acetyltransferase